MNIKRLIMSAAIAWLLGVSAYTASFFLNIMENAELQANLVLMLALIPSAIIGTNFYYKKKEIANGFILGIAMFGITVVFDALITVPVFIIPMGGSHLTFFGDLSFWLIGLEYILVVGFYAIRQKRMSVNCQE